MTWGQRPAGFATLEWTVAFSLTLVLLALTAQFLSTFLRFGFLEVYRAQWHQESTLTGAILSGEVGRASSSADWQAHPGDSLTLRAFRGHAWICGSNSPSTVTVVFQGDRHPNPAKDSVLIHSAIAGARVAQLRSRRSGSSSCGSTLGRPTEEWDLGGPAPMEGILRLFESGTYSIANGALRYRVGRGGRQPVVGARFDTASFLRPQATPAGEDVARLQLASTPGPYRKRQLWYGRTTYSRRSIP